MKWNMARWTCLIAFGRTLYQYHRGTLFKAIKHVIIPSLSACPLSLGLEDGRIKDEQMSASSELDKKHAAKKGRITYKTKPNG